MFIFAPRYFFSFFFNDTAPNEIYTLSLHDALPISLHRLNVDIVRIADHEPTGLAVLVGGAGTAKRSEEHTSELQSHSDLVCRLLLEKKKSQKQTTKRVRPMRKRG